MASPASLDVSTTAPVSPVSPASPVEVAASRVEVLIIVDSWMIGSSFCGPEVGSDRSTFTSCHLQRVSCVEGDQGQLQPTPRQQSESDGGRDLRGGLPGLSSFGGNEGIAMLSVRKFGGLQPDPNPCVTQRSCCLQLRRLFREPAGAFFLPVKGKFCPAWAPSSESASGPGHWLF